MGDQYLDCVYEKYAVKMAVGMNCFRIQSSLQAFMMCIVMVL